VRRDGRLLGVLSALAAAGLVLLLVGVTLLVLMLLMLRAG